MSTSPSSASWSVSQPVAPAGGLRFGTSQSSDGAVEWLLRRNCSLTPKQMLAAYGGLCGISLAVAVFFWVQGARLVMPFAWLELLAFGASLWVFARHAGDRERIALREGRLTVELTNAGQVDRIEFDGWVRVEPGRDPRALIELSIGGRKVNVGRHVRPELRPMLADELRYVLRGRWFAMQHDTA